MHRVHADVRRAPDEPGMIAGASSTAGLLLRIPRSPHRRVPLHLNGVAYPCRKKQYSVLSRFASRWQ